MTWKLSRRSVLDFGFLDLEFAEAFRVEMQTFKGNENNNDNVMDKEQLCEYVR